MKTVFLVSMHKANRPQFGEILLGIFDTWEHAESSVEVTYSQTGGVVEQPKQLHKRTRTFYNSRRDEVIRIVEHDVICEVDHL
jgi:hypothetical protein